MSPRNLREPSFLTGGGIPSSLSTNRGEVALETKGQIGWQMTGVAVTGGNELCQFSDLLTCCQPSWLHVGAGRVVRNCFLFKALNEG